MLSSLPGALENLRNAFINAGGEIEKRRGQVRDTAFPVFTFGLQDTDSGLMTFGSRPNTAATGTRARASNVATVTVNVFHFLQVGNQVTVAGLGGVGYNGTFTITAVTSFGFSYASVEADEGSTSDTGGTVTFAYTLPTGVTYQVLTPTRPDGSTIVVSVGAVYMTAAIYTCNFKGKAFVIAQFSDSRLYWFYNGSLIRQSVDGYVTLVSGVAETPTELSKDLAALIDLITGWDGTANVDAAGTTLAGSTKVTSPVDVYYKATTEENATSGTFVDANYSSDYAGTIQAPAKAFFGVGGFLAGRTYTVKAPANMDGTGQVTLANAVASVNNDADTAKAIRDAINANTGLYGYTSTVNGTDVFVYAPVEWGNDPNSWTFSGTQGLEVTTSDNGGQGSGGGGSGTLVAHTNPTSVFGETHGTSISALYVKSSAATVAAAGGIAPYKYEWEGDNQNSGITAKSRRNVTTVFEATLAPGQSATENFVCHVTDSSVPPVTVDSDVVHVLLTHNRT